MTTEARIRVMLERIERVAWDLARAGEHLRELEDEARKLAAEAERVA